MSRLILSQFPIIYLQVKKLETISFLVDRLIGTMPLLAKSLNSYDKKVIISSSLNIQNKYKFNSNVIFKETHDTISLINLIREAKYIVIPIEDNLTTSGLKIINWGLELGKAMIVTKTYPYRDLWTFTAIYLCRCFCESSLRNAIYDLDNNEDKINLLAKNAREWSLSNLTSSDYINSLWENYVKKIQ